MTHEFHSSEPTAEAGVRRMKAGENVPETGEYECASCAETVTATIMLLEKDQQLPVCHTCGPMTAWKKR